MIQLNSLKLNCDSRFQRAFTACSCVFKEITLVGTNQHNYFEKPNASSKRALKTTVATQLYNGKIMSFRKRGLLGFAPVMNAHFNSQIFSFVNDFKKSFFHSDFTI